MSTFLLEFSPTGGTAAVMAHVAKAFVVDTRIDLSCDDDWSGLQFNRRDVCLIGFPCYGGRVPAVALERLRQLNGAGARAVLIAVYGNRDFEDALLEMYDASRKYGFRPVAAVAAVAQHSLLPQYGAGRPDADDADELYQFGLEIKQDLLDEPDKEKVRVPGNRPYRRYRGVPLKPRVRKRMCIDCGLCATKCPVDAISIDQPTRTNRKRCISCMRCVQICPAHARYVNPLKLRVAGVALKRACKQPKRNLLFL